MTRKTYQIEFVKCTRLDSNHCSKQGIQAVNFFKFLQEHGGMVPTPKPSKVYNGHYNTLLHIAKMHPNLDFKDYLPTLKGKSQYSCLESTCRYIFNSNADKKRHNLHLKKGLDKMESPLCLCETKYEPMGDPYDNLRVTQKKHGTNRERKLCTTWQ